MNVDHLDLDELDVDGALRETADVKERLTRGSLMLGAAGAALGVAAVRATPARAATAASDVAILNYALSLEYLQDAFYTESERNGALRGEPLRMARVVGGVERAHVKALRAALGPKAIKRPAFNFRGVTESQAGFIRTAVQFEDLAVAAYKGQAYKLASDEILATALSIHSVEARHAAWIRYLAGKPPVQDALDMPKSREAVLREVAATRFLARAPRTRSRARPRFTG